MVKEAIQVNATRYVYLLNDEHKKTTTIAQ